jgi:hypothetical protein
MAVAGKKDPLKQQKDSIPMKNAAIEKLSKLNFDPVTQDPVYLKAKKKYDSLVMANPRAAEKFRRAKNSRNKAGEYAMYIAPAKKTKTTSKTPMGRK